MNAVYTKRRKFEKFEKFLNAREDELIRRGIKNIKNLEKLKKKKRLKKEKINANTVATSEPTGVNFSSLLGAANVGSDSLLNISFLLLSF